MDNIARILILAVLVVHGEVKVIGKVLYPDEIKKKLV